MKRVVFILSFLLLTGALYSQVTLEECRQKTQENYPLVRQYDLIEKTKEYNLENAAKGYLPQFAFSAKATYQSDITELPVRIPGVDIKSLPKDQYQVMMEVRQSLWDGGEVRMQKKQVKATSEVDKKQLQVDMYALNERVNQLYFGILLLDEQLQQNGLLQAELERSYRQVSVYVENGIANQADIDAVKVEQLNTSQKRIELAATRQAYLQMLSLLTGEEFTAGTRFAKPPVENEFEKNALFDVPVRRPELQWLDAQAHFLEIEEDALKIRYLPRFGLFIQGAYGNPGLNMLESKFTPYYMAGVRLSWNFGSLYTLKNDRRVIENNRRKLQTNRDVFLFNTRLQVAQQSNAITAMKKQMEKDDEIIRLRNNIRKSAETKVANGTWTVIDMLREITNESLAKQTKALHEVQLLMNIYQLKYTTNN